jgi:hypothetical protein
VASRGVRCWTQDEVTGGRTKLLNEELYSLYPAPLLLVGHVARMGKMRN